MAILFTLFYRKASILHAILIKKNMTFVMIAEVQLSEDMRTLLKLAIEVARISSALLKMS